MCQIKVVVEISDKEFGEVFTNAIHMNNYSLILFIGSIVLSMMGAHSISQKKTEGALAFGLFMFAAAVYSFGCAMELAVGPLSGKKFWIDVEYAGIPFLPTLWMIFSIQYAGKRKWLSRRLVISAIGISILIMILEWTNGIHHLYYRAVALDTSGPFPVIATTKGFFYWLFIAYANFAAACGDILLLYSFRRGQRMYRTQALVILIGSIATWVSLIAYLVGKSPGGLDITPLGFAATGIIYVWGTFRYRMLDIVPIALDNIWENMKDGMMLVDDAGRLLNFNRTAKEVLSIFADPSQGMNVSTDFGSFSEYVGECSSVENECKVLTVSIGGRRTSFQVSASPIMDSRKRGLGKAIVLSDITEREEMKLEISESERKYRELVENSLVGVYKFSLSGRLLYANKAMANMLEYDSPEELEPISFWSLYKNSRERGPFAEELRAFGKTGQSKEVELVTKKGKTRNVLLSASLDRDEISGMAKDITEIRTLESQFIQAQKLEGLGNIAAGIAHDFNNLLGVILGYSEWIEKSGHDPNRIERGMKAIMKSAERGKSLVKQLLTFARKTDTTFIPLQLNDTIRELGKLMTETFARTIEISTRLMEGLPLISGDPTQMNQVLLNMCVNARDAMGKGGKLAISTRKVAAETLKERHPNVGSGDYVEIQISDTGIGMDEETRRRIFEPFFTTKGIGKGTGLGLSVAYGIVESHRGFIDVASESGKGTVFSVYLPVIETTSVEIPIAAQSTSEIQGGGETVLVAEDEGMLRELITSTLNSKGYRTLSAADGYEALDVFRRNEAHISLVISDLGLPKLNGEDVISGVKRLKPRAKIIVASGFIEPEIRSRLEQSGVNRFIPKPYLMEEVLAKVREVLDSP